MATMLEQAVLAACTAEPIAPGELFEQVRHRTGAPHVEIRAMVWHLVACHLLNFTPDWRVYRLESR